MKKKQSIKAVKAWAVASKSEGIRWWWNSNDDEQFDIFLNKSDAKFACVQWNKMTE